MSPEQSLEYLKNIQSRVSCFIIKVMGSTQLPCRALQPSLHTYFRDVAIRSVNNPFLYPSRMSFRDFRRLDFFV